MKGIKPNPANRSGRLHHYLHESRRLIVIVYEELLRTRAFTIAAALAFYFLLAVVPTVVVFTSLLRFLPVSSVFQQSLNLMAELVPPEAMTLVGKIVTDILAPNRGKLLSFGILGYIWAASGGFSSLIESLDIAYEVPVSRSWWRDRVRALLLTTTSGGLVTFSILLLFAGPHFGHFMSEVFPVFRLIERFWPELRLLLVGATFVTALELVYYLGPNCRHSFLSTLPGAVVAIAIWVLGSTGLNYYLRHFSNYNTTYGSMGAVIGLMLWFYVTALAILIGAELNAELTKQLARLRSLETLPAEPSQPETPSTGAVPAAQ
jgi:membrane protein